MTSPKEVLEKYFGRPLSMEWDGEEGFANKESIKLALSDLAEIVRGQKMQYHLSFCDRFNYSDDICVNTVLCNCGRDSFNSAYDHIAKIIREGGNEGNKV